MTKLCSNCGKRQLTDEESTALLYDSVEKAGEIVRLKRDVEKHHDTIMELNAQLQRLEDDLTAYVYDPLHFCKIIQNMREFTYECLGPATIKEKWPGLRDHIQKELDEIAEDPNDITEWIDIIVLALDGAIRAGADNETIAYALNEKIEINKKRTWPDWRKVPKGKAIEHVRE